MVISRVPPLTALGLLYFVFAISAKNTIDEQHEIVLNDDYNVQLKWRVDADDVLFEMSANTQGYVAIGFSPNGGMPGSDIVVGWMTNGKGFISDRHATAYTKPATDSSEDYQLLYAYEESGRTTIAFKRKIDTCDPDDYTISSDTARVIWAVNDNNPGTNPDDLSYHGSSRGVRSVILLDSAVKLKNIPSHAESFDILMPNITIPDHHTTYWCTAFAVPDFKEQIQVFRFDTIVQPGHEALVHHLILFACYGNYSAIAGFSKICDKPNMPQDLKVCEQIMYAWAVGGGPFEFPDHVGFSLGGHDDPKFFYLEIHYDNPSRKADVIDSSGLRIYYTRTRKRQYDAGIWTIGEAYLFGLQAIPPKETEFKTVGFCTGKCTEEANTDVNIFGIILHGHLALRKAVLHHYRNGKLIDEVRDNNYDFNLQEIRRIQPEKIYKRGDDYAMTCVYNTMDRENITRGGESTLNEMCLSFLFYYPRNPNLTVCLSAPTVSSVADAFQLDESNPEVLLRNIEELDPKQIKDGLTQVVYNGSQINFCGINYVPTVSSVPDWYKANQQAKQDKSTCSSTDDTNGCNKQIMPAYYFNIIVLLTILVLCL